MPVEMGAGSSEANAPYRGLLFRRLKIGVASDLRASRIADSTPGLICGEALDAEGGKFTRFLHFGASRLPRPMAAPVN